MCKNMTVKIWLIGQNKALKKHKQVNYTKTAESLQKCLIIYRELQYFGQPQIYLKF
jgi:hypothetical protein